MTPKTAASLLCVDRDTMTREIVQEAFRAAIRAAHPDSGAYDVRQETANLQELRDARDALVAECERLGALAVCPKCVGEGRVRTPRGPKVACSTCDGEGVVRRR